MELFLKISGMKKEYVSIEQNKILEIFILQSVEEVMSVFYVSVWFILWFQIPESKYHILNIK